MNNSPLGGGSVANLEASAAARTFDVLGAEFLRFDLIFHGGAGRLTSAKENMVGCKWGLKCFNCGAKKPANRQHELAGLLLEISGNRSEGGPDPGSWFSSFHLLLCFQPLQEV